MIFIASSRPLKKRGSFQEVLANEGMVLEEFPLIDFESLTESSSVFEKKYKWALLSSAETLDHLNDDELNKIVNWFCVGQKCSDSLARRGITSFYVSSKKSMRGLLEEIKENKLLANVDDELLYPCSQEAEWTEKEVESLFGIKLKRVDCYRIKSIDQSSKIIEKKPKCWIHFSGSAVRALESQNEIAKGLIKKALHFAWGQTAAKELEKMNLNYVSIDHSKLDENWAKELKEKIEENL